MPEISVIMGVYNELNKDILMEAVNSILHQTFEDFEFIIYDDGSCPEAATLLREVAGLDERIKLIGQDENHGLAFSLNACIDEAKGKYIARMDADDISYSERLMKQKKFLDKYQEYSWVGCNIDVFDQNGVWGERKMPEFPIEQDYLRFSPYAHPTVMYRACYIYSYMISFFVHKLYPLHYIILFFIEYDPSNYTAQHCRYRQFYPCCIIRYSSIYHTLSCNINRHIYRIIAD